MDRTWNLVRTVFVVLAVGGLVAGCVQGADRATSSPAPTDTAVGPSTTPSPEATPTPTPSNVAVAISPTSGPPGSEVQVTAAGFSPEAEIELCLGRKDSEYDVLTTARTGTDGALVTTLAIPSGAKPDEAWVVVAATEDGATKAVSNAFQVTAPQYAPEVSISPTGGPPGTEIQVAAQGFPSAVRVEIGVGRENSEYDVVNTSETRSDGSLIAIVSIPAYAEVDERWVVIVTTQNRSVDAISNTFQVARSGYRATVTVSPQSGPPGTQVDVVAEGFPPNAELEIGVGRVNAEYDVVATTQANANGRADAQITIPSFVEPEDHWVVVVAAEGQPIKAVSDEFDVTRSPTPSGNLFTRTNITLIAIGDNGQSGKLIGCGDSAVPVEVPIEPTIAPLTAALNKLLSFRTREYDQSGLYNALYRSDLTLEDSEIVNREAVIRLSGTLTLGGVCDEPRVRAQLEETALQYTTVDSVSIFINGTPLEEMLGEE